MYDILPSKEDSLMVGILSVLVCNPPKTLSAYNSLATSYNPLVMKYYYSPYVKVCAKVTVSNMDKFAHQSVYHCHFDIVTS